jgi:hypothetical protein
MLGSALCSCSINYYDRAERRPPTSIHFPKTNAAWISPLFPRTDHNRPRLHVRRRWGKHRRDSNSRHLSAAIHFISHPHKGATRDALVPARNGFGRDMWDYLCTYGAEKQRGMSMKTFREQFAAHDTSAAKVRADVLSLRAGPVDSAHIALKGHNLVVSFLGPPGGLRAGLSQRSQPAELGPHAAAFARHPPRPR